MNRTLRIAATGAAVGALFLPVAIDRDGIPLSTYPMYSRARTETVSLVTANGIDRDGERVRLGLDVIGGSDDPLIVAGELRATIRNDRAADRCALIAGRVDARSGSANDERRIVAIEVVTERHDTVDRTAGRASLLQRSVHARCNAGSS